MVTALLMQQTVVTYGLQCLSNNDNSTTAFPSNTSKTVECQGKYACGAVLLYGINSAYFKKGCGDNKSMYPSCASADTRLCINVAS